MSLMIDQDVVGKVMIGGHWYEVVDGSFEVDCFEIIQKWQNWNQTKEMVVYKLEWEGAGGSGCSFETEMDGNIVRLHAPMSAVQALVESNDLVEAKRKKMKAEADRVAKVGG